MQTSSTSQWYVPNWQLNAIISYKFFQADTAFLPIKMLPWLLDDEESQHKDGLRGYPGLLTRLGSNLNVVETFKKEGSEQPSIYPTLIILVFALWK